MIIRTDSFNLSNVPHFYGEAALSGWAAVVNEVRQAGGRIIPQIWHMGARGQVDEYIFWEKTNPRTDSYGGDMLARTRFATEVIEACRQAVGPEFPIVFLARFLAPLSDACKIVTSTAFKQGETSGEKVVIRVGEGTVKMPSL